MLLDIIICLKSQNEAEDVGGEEAEDVITLIVQGGITAVYLKQKLLYSVGREILDRSWNYRRK